VREGATEGDIVSEVGMFVDKSQIICIFSEEVVYPPTNATFAIHHLYFAGFAAENMSFVIERLLWRPAQI
jgi:hypothetical protein